MTCQWYCRICLNYKEKARNGTTPRIRFDWRMQWWNQLSPNNAKWSHSRVGYFGRDTLFQTYRKFTVLQTCVCRNWRGISKTCKKHLPDLQPGIGDVPGQLIQCQSPTDKKCLSDFHPENKENMDSSFLGKTTIMFVLIAGLGLAYTMQKRRS